MEEKVKKRTWVKDVAIIFLAVMLVLTFFSNTILNRSLPEAATVLVEPGSIDSKVRVSGTVSARENYDVILEQSRRVASVAVKVGQEVSTGDVLFTLEPGDSDELEAAKDELRALEMQYQRALINAGSADYALENRDIAQAREALEEGQAKLDALPDVTDAQIAEAKTALTNANATVKEYQKDVNEAETGVQNSSEGSDGGGGASSSQTTAYKQAVKRLETAQAALASAKSYYASGYQQLKNEAQQKILEDYNAAHPTETKSDYSQLPQEYKDEQKLNNYIQLIAQQYAPKDDIDTDAYYTAYSKIAEAQKAYNQADAAFKYAEAAQADEPSSVNQAKMEVAAANRTAAKQTLISVKSYYSSQYQELENLAKEKLVQENSVPDYSAVPAEEKAKLGDYIQLIAEDKLITFEQEIDPRYTAYVQISEAQRTVEEAERDVENAKAALNDANRTDSYDDGTDYKGKSHSYWVKTYQEASEKLATAQESQTELREKLEELEQQQADYTAAKENVRTLQNTLEDQVFRLEQQQKADGKQQQLDALDRQEIQHQISDAKERIEKLSGGDDLTEIKAKVNGTVQSLAVSAGHTANAGDVLAAIEVKDLGYTMNATVTNEQARLLHVGDTATVSNFYWGSATTAEITAIRPDPKNPQSGKLLMFDISGDVAAGSQLNFSIGEKNASYDLVVPNSAVRSDTNGSFVLIITAKNSPLGNRYYATRVDVEVVASDDLNSAIKGALEGYDTVITTTSNNAPLKNGDQVRLPDVN